MNISVREDRGFLVMTLDGEADLQHTPSLRKSLLEAVSGGRPVVVDMSHVSYIDSSGVASLVEAYQSARKKGFSFALAGLSPAALRVLQLARLDRVFTIHTTIDSAVGE